MLQLIARTSVLFDGEQFEPIALNSGRIAHSALPAVVLLDTAIDPELGAIVVCRMQRLVVGRLNRRRSADLIPQLEQAHELGFRVFAEMAVPFYRAAYAAENSAITPRTVGLHLPRTGEIDAWLRMPAAERKAGSGAAHARGKPVIRKFRR